MDSNKKPWPITTVFGIKERIDTNPDFQRPAVWGRSQKQMLIDTVLRGYDIPKLYWRKTGAKPDKYDVVDGQQRLRALWEFSSGAYALPKNAEPVEGTPIAGLKYEGLPDELRIHFDTYPLDVVILTETDEDEVREMFLRLQNGTSLKAQEKRNAMPGKMRDFVRNLASHPIFGSCAFANKRYTHDHVAAQMTLIELEGGPCNVKNADLNKMYRTQLTFDDKCTKAKRIRRTLDFLRVAFPDTTPELERYNVISLYCLVSQLLERYAISDRHGDVAMWFVEFEKYRREQKVLSEDEAESEMIAYHEKISHSTDSQDSIKWRHELLIRKLFEKFSDIELKDDQRLFTHEQRLAIYRRDQGICQLAKKCDGRKCEWNAWEADHKIPWSKGGRTVVANGQVACPECNASKGARAA
ncbi:MAG: DUF262 domain-containing protein [candidate division Zixibacteria bacterium]|nr:DUF262 domain-containing protein [candidate division Zixibacteria bacterium]MDH3937249.1 DUF262 domain-containing protein [candidate division Zixibacteria bacterium]MDH4033283.1 DUF262 domain-containing protein [candidate division Zixibacteria bacterium]